MEPRRTQRVELVVREFEDRRRALPRSGLRMGYRTDDVDRFLMQTITTLRKLVDENQGLRAGVSPENLWFGDAQGRLTPLDVQEIEFPIARWGKGYRMRPVDELIDDVTLVLQAVLDENGRLRSGPREDR